MNLDHFTAVERQSPHDKVIRVLRAWIAPTHWPDWLREPAQQPLGSITLPIPKGERWIATFVQCRACRHVFMAARLSETLSVECPTCHVITLLDTL